MTDPLTWVLGYAGKKSLDWLLSASAKEDLHRRLRKTVTDWSASLPPEISVVPDALFPDTIDTAMANDPAIVELASRLSENRLPTVDHWVGMIDARRRFVRASAELGQLQPFFSSTEEQVRVAILELGQRIDRECRQDPKLYKGETLAKLEELARSIDELKAAGPPRPLRWTEEHVLMTLGLGVDSTSAEREDVKRTKLHHFNQSLLGVLSGSESFAQLLVRQSQALGMPIDSALDLWIRDSVELPPDLTTARASLAILGWRFETADSRIEFSSPKATVNAESQYTADLISFLHTMFPRLGVWVECMDHDPSGHSGLNSSELLKGVDSALRQGYIKVLVIPFTSEGEKSEIFTHVFRTIAALGVIPVLPLSFRHATTTHSFKERIAVVTSPLLAALARKEGDEVLCFPVAQFSRESDGSAKIVSNDSLGCMVAGGVASLLVSNAPKRTSAEIMKALHDSRGIPTYPIPSYGRALKLLT